MVIAGFEMSMPLSEAAVCTGTLDEWVKRVSRVSREYRRLRKERADIVVFHLQKTTQASEIAEVFQVVLSVSEVIRVRTLNSA